MENALISIEKSLTLIESNEFKKIVRGELINDVKYKQFYKNNDNKNLAPLVWVENIEVDWVILDENFDYPYDIYLKNIIIKRNFCINNGNFTNNINCTNLQISKNAYFAINGGNFNNISFDGIASSDGSYYFKGGKFNIVSFYGGIYEEGISIINGIFKEIYISSNANFKIGLFFRGGDAEIMNIAGGDINEFHFNGGKVGMLSIYGLSQINKIYINGGILDSITLNSEGIKYLKISNFKQLKSEEQILTITNILFAQLNKVNVHVSNILIKKIVFDSSYIHKDSVFIFNNVSTEILSFSDITNFGQISFNNLSIMIDGKFDINNSDIGKTTFINCNIDESIMLFNSSKIIEMFLIGTKLPKVISGISYHQKQLGYGQIKKLFENRGDSIESNRYYSMEMNSYFSSLEFRSNFWDKINLALNKLSTNHNQSWRRGLFTTILFAALLYFAYCYAIGYRPASIKKIENLENFVSLLSYFSEFINPVHKTDYILDSLKLKPQATLASMARIIEGISRIIISYFIYQFIQSFRKFGKR